MEMEPGLRFLEDVKKWRNLEFHVIVLDHPVCSKGAEL